MGQTERFLPLTPNAENNMRRFPARQLAFAIVMGLVLISLLSAGAMTLQLLQEIKIGNDMAQVRQLNVAMAIKAALDQAVAFGTPIRDHHAAVRLIDESLEFNHDLQAIGVTDNLGGEVILKGDSQLWGQLSAAWKTNRSLVNQFSQRPLIRRLPNHRVIAVQLALGSGTVWLICDSEKGSDLTQKTWEDNISWLTLILGSNVLVAIVGLYSFIKRSKKQIRDDNPADCSLENRLEPMLWGLAAICVLATAIISLRIHNQLTPYFETELSQSAFSSAARTRDLLSFPMKLGFELDDMIATKGIDDALGNTLMTNADLAFVAVMRSDRPPVVRASNPEVLIDVKQRLARFDLASLEPHYARHSIALTTNASLVVGYPIGQAKIYRWQAAGTLALVLFVVGAVLRMTLPSVAVWYRYKHDVLLTGHCLTSPTPVSRQLQCSLSVLLLFMITLADEMTRPILAAYIAFDVDYGPFSPAVASLGTIQMAAFFLAWAAAPLLGHNWMRQRSIHRWFWIVSCLYVISHILLGSFTDWSAVLVSRILGGFAFGFLQYLLQTAVLRTIPPDEVKYVYPRFAAAFMIAGMVGPLIGGQLADHIPLQTLFWFSAVVAASAGLLAWYVIPRDLAGSETSTRWQDALLTFCKVSTLRRVGLGSMLSTRFVSTSLVGILIPLIGAQLSASGTAIGLCIAAYFVGCYIGNSQANRLAGKTGASDIRILGTNLLLVSAVFVGTGFCAYLGHSISLVWLGAASFLTGASHGIAGVLQLNFMLREVAKIAQTNKNNQVHLGREAAMVVFRLFERIGSGVASLMFPVLILVGPAGCFGILFLLTVACGIFLLFSSSRNTAHDLAS